MKYEGGSRKRKMVVDVGPSAPFSGVDPTADNRVR